MAAPYGTGGRNCLTPRTIIPKENESWDNNGFMKMPVSAPYTYILHTWNDMTFSAVRVHFKHYCCLVSRNAYNYSCKRLNRIYDCRDKTSYQTDYFTARHSCTLCSGGTNFEFQHEHRVPCCSLLCFAQASKWTLTQRFYLWREHNHFNATCKIILSRITHYFCSWHGVVKEPINKLTNPPNQTTHTTKQM